MQPKLWHSITRGLSIAGASALLLASGASTADAQLWQSTHHYSGSDIGRSLLLLADNTIVTAGEKLTGTSSADVVVMQSRPCGDVIWTVPYDIGGRDQVSRIRETSDGGFIVVGTTQNINTQGCGTRDDIFLLKIGAGGSVAWCRVYGGCGLEEGRDVQVTDDGYVIAGSTTSYGAGGVDAYLIRTDLNGTPVWGRTYGGSGLDFFTSCDLDANDDVVAVGETFSYTNSSNGDIFVAHVDGSTGAPTSGFPKRYGGDENDLAWSVLVDPISGNFVIAGGTKSYGENSEAFLLMLQPNGTPLRLRTFGGFESNGWDEFLDMTLHGEEYLVTGIFNNAPGGWGGYDMFVGTFDGIFNTVSAQLHGGSGDDQGWGVATNPAISGNENIVVTGFTNSLGVSSQDFYLVRQNDTGFTGCEDARPELYIMDRELDYEQVAVSMTNAAAWCERTITEGLHEEESYLCLTSCEFPWGKVKAAEGDAGGAETLKIYPNPVAGTHAFVLEYAPARNTGIDLTITDMAGTVVGRRQGSAASGRMELSTEGWAAGTYLVQVKIGERVNTRQVTVLGK